jgi:hypothetical protein
MFCGLTFSAGAADIEQIEDLEVHTVNGTADLQISMNIGTPFGGGTGVALLKWDETDAGFAGMNAANLSIQSLENPPHTTDGSFTVHQMITSWDESTDFGTTLPVAGVDYNSHPHAVVGWNSINNNPDGRADTANLTELVNAWVSSNIPNNGLILVPEGQLNPNYPNLDGTNSPAYDPESGIASRHRVPGSLDSDDQRISTSTTASPLVPGVIEAMADSTLNESVPNGQSKNAPQSNIGVDGGGNRTYMLYKFGLGEVTATEPFGDWNFSTADFQLHTVSAGNPEQGFDIHQVLTPWTEAGVTWNQFGTNGPQPGVDYDASPIGTAVLGDGTKFDDVDIVNCANFWLDNPTENYGLIVIPTNGTPAGSEHLLSTSERVRGVLDGDDTRLNYAAATVFLPPDIIDVGVGDVPAPEFVSQPGVEYMLEYDTGGGFVDTGARMTGTGGTNTFFDPTGFDTGKTYRVRTP